MNIKAVISIAKCSSYNAEVKKSFKRAGLNFCKDLAARLQLPEGSFDISFNEGGIAVSGEVTLHHENFYLQISDSGCFYRECKGRRDFTGGRNCWVEGFGESETTDEIVNRILNILPAKTC
jgi:hypothetical protein